MLDLMRTCGYWIAAQPWAPTLTWMLAWTAAACFLLGVFYAVTRAFWFLVDVDRVWRETHGPSGPLETRRRRNIGERRTVKAAAYNRYVRNFIAGRRS